MNVLLIGLGRWGEKHLRVLGDVGATVWVADVSAARRQWAIDRGVAPGRAVEDYRAALDRVEAVDVVTPADSHLAIAETCLRAGTHCFIEKPLTQTAAEGRRLVDAARDAGRVVQVGHIFRFHPVTAALDAAIAGGRIGAVRYATGRFSGFKRPRTDVGVFQTDGIHYADLFRHLLRRDPSGVSALQRDFLGRGLDDLSMAVVHYGDVPVVIDANYFEPGTHRECVIVGESGSLVADYGTGTVTLHSGEHRRSGVGWEAVDTGKEELAASGPEPLRLELEAFLDACAGRRAVPVTAADGLIAVEVAEAATESARRSRLVTLAELRPGD
jgi:UDP-N-acetylglucosamine 3-dehydrogenase